MTSKVLIAFIIGLMAFSPLEAVEFNPKEIYKKSSKAVVLILGFEPGQKTRMMGTGSIISPDGLVLTNAHVIYNEKTKRPFSRIRIFTKPNRLTGNIKRDTANGFDGRLLKYDNPLDLAVLKIRLNSRIKIFPHLEFIPSEKIDIGEPVVAIGHPEQGGLWSLTTGTISSMKADFENVKGKNVFQTETSINRGNSGGPLLESEGYIVGVNSNIARKGSGGIAITDVNFAIQSSVAVTWLKTNGYNMASPFAGATVFEKSTTPKTPAGIIPVPPEKEPENIPSTPQKIVKPAEPVPPTSTTISPPPPKPKPEPKEEILTKKRPFSMDDLFLQVEAEMEDMMDEMKDKGKRKSQFPKDF